MKRLPLLIALLLMTQGASAAMSQTELLRPFPDVPTTHPNAEAIVFLQANHVIQGNPDGTFRPDNTINRAEFLKILVESVGDSHVIETCVQDNPNSLFRDVSANDWFAKYVCTAKKFAMVYGNPDGTFRPQNPLNFAEAAVLLIRNLGFLKDAPKPTTDWYRPFVQVLADKHAIPPSITGFDRAITRGEMAEMMYRLQAPIPPKQSLTYAEVEARSRMVPAQFASKSSVVSSGTSKASNVSGASLASVSSGGSASVQSASSARSGSASSGSSPTLITP